MWEQKGHEWSPATHSVGIFYNIRLTRHQRVAPIKRSGLIEALRSAMILKPVHNCPRRFWVIGRWFDICEASETIVYVY